MPPPAAGRAVPPPPRAPHYDPPPYEPPPYEPPPAYDPYGQPAYPPQPYDTGVTQVFDTSGLRGQADPFGDAHTMVTGMPAYDDDFGRSATARIDFAQPAGQSIGPFGPHEAFGPPPEEVEPEPEPDAEHVFSRFRRIRSHAQQKRKKRRGWVGVVVVLVLFAAAAGVKFLPISPWHAPASKPEPVAVPIPFHAATFSAGDVGTEGFLSWAYQDLRVPNGMVVGSENQNETTATASMITAWFAADLLRRSAEQGVDPTEAQKADVEAMIQDDDASAADRVVAALGSYKESIDRLTAMCRLAATLPGAQSWRDTAMSAQDAARLGGCIADQTAAGAEWTPWLLNVMRQVRGSGDFGIREAFPAQQRANIAIKNGVMLDEKTGQWQANCLAVGDDWSLAVLQRYAATGDEAADLAHVDDVCQQVVHKLTE